MITISKELQQVTPINRNCHTDPSPTRHIPEEAYSQQNSKNPHTRLTTC